MNLTDAYQLLHEGMLAFADIETHGMCLDVDYCKRQERHLSRQIEHLQKKFMKTELGKTWKKYYGRKVDIGSPHQLSKVLFEKMGLTPPKKTAKGNPSVDQKALSSFDNPDVQVLLRIRKLKDLRVKNIRGLLREQDGGMLHPFFNLHLARSYRSSSDSPNYQNVPVRDEEGAKVVRRAFIPRPGRQLVEMDFSGIEVRVAACLHKDPVMLEYLNDPTKDMHRDMACECYKLPHDQCTKQIRYCGKNMFVFPQFYGSYYKNCAKSLWEQVGKLATKDGILLRGHLLSLKDPIDRLSKFEEHIEKVEHDFWNKRFKVYTKWKETQYERYLATAEIRMFTGFQCHGVIGKNESVNYPMQGPAFHCLLWALIRLNTWLKEKGKKTVLIGQIHDSLILDAVPSEVKSVVRMARKIMCRDIRKAWPWITVPLEVEVEISAVDGNWFQMEEYVQ